MEMIPEETTAVEPREGPTEPGPALSTPGDQKPPEPPGPAGSPGTPQERTLPGATGQPLDPTRATEQPGPGGQPSSTEAEPPPSPYLTPDFGKEDPFEILGKAVRCLPYSRTPGPSAGWQPGVPRGSARCLRCPPVLPAHALGLSPARWPSSSCFTINRAKCVMSPPRAAPAWHSP